MTWSIDIENVGGIRSGSATLKPGINSVRASNWQGKSSFIRAIKTVMGTDRPLTEGQSSGRVQLRTPAETTTVQLSQQGRSVNREGDPFLSDPYVRRCAELFAFLDESNEVRRAVRAGENLESVLTEPLDLANIDEQIRDLKREREQVEAELDRATSASNRVPALEREIESTEAELETLETELSELRSDAGDDTDVASLRSELSNAQSEKEQVEDLIKRTRNAIERTQSKLNERYEELESIDVPENGDLAAKIEREHDQLSELEGDKELLETLYSANARILSEDRLELLGEVEHGVMEDNHTCWVCGSETTRTEIEQQLDSMREKIETLGAEVSDRRGRVEELQERRDERRSKQKREQDLHQEIQRLEDTLADHEDSLQSAEGRHDVLEERVESLEEEVEHSDDRLTSVESELKYTEAQLEDLREELEECRREAEQRELLEDERDELTDEIEQLRSRKDRIRAETRRAFDDAIDEVIPLFETSFESAHLTGNFDLVVARDGREASLDALSEGEVELLGIVVALAGYEAYDVGDDVPALLLDGLGGLSDESLNTLVEYLEDRAKMLVLTAYPENETLGDWEINPADWSVVSNRGISAV